MHKADITKMLGQMCIAHLLESAGRGRGTKYHVYGYNVGLQDINVALPDANVALSGANVALSGANVALSGANVALQDANVALPKRYTKEQLKEIIKEVCLDWVTAEIIAARIGRDVKYVKNHVLPKLTDVLEKMYDVPHHPKQKYRTRQKEE